MGVAAWGGLGDETGGAVAADPAFEQPVAGGGEGAGVHARVVVRGAQAHARGVFPAGSGSAGTARDRAGAEPVELVAVLRQLQLRGRQPAVLPAAVAVVCRVTAVAAGRLQARSGLNALAP